MVTLWEMVTQNCSELWIVHNTQSHWNKLTNLASLYSGKNSRVDLVLLSASERRRQDTCRAEVAGSDWRRSAKRPDSETFRSVRSKSCQIVTRLRSFYKNYWCRSTTPCRPPTPPSSSWGSGRCWNVSKQMLSSQYYKSFWGKSALKSRSDGLRKMHWKVALNIACIKHSELEMILSAAFYVANYAGLNQPIHSFI